MTAALVAVFCLVLGVVCGLMFGRATNTPYQEAKELKDQLDQVKYEYETYKSEVTQHFTKTAELVNSMTDNYRNVHSHLANGAQSLCAGALQLESMGGKEALEAQAEEVTETKAETTAEEAPAAEAVSSEATTEETTTTTQASAEGGNGAEAEAAASETAEPIKVDAETVAEATTATDGGSGAEGATKEEAPVELVADAAASEKQQSETRVH